jgi:hypothetical protein
MRAACASTLKAVASSPMRSISFDTSAKPRNESAAVGLFPVGPPVALKA